MESLFEKQVKRAGLISRTIDNLKKIGQANITQGAVEARITNLEEKWSDFKTQHEALENQATAEDFNRKYFKEDYYLQTEEIYLTNKGTLLEWLRKLKASQGESQSAVSVQPSLLKKIDMPKFSGKFTEWRNFRDLFQSVVIDNTSYADITRLHYLMMYVEDEPAALLASTPLAGTSFATAWATLTTRYNNIRLLTIAHISEFMSIPSMTSESPSELRALHSGTVNAVAALKAIGRPVDSCSDFIVYLTVQKLDVQSRREWETAVCSRKEPSTLLELTSFLENRVCSLESLEYAVQTRSTPSAAKSTTINPSKQKGNSSSSSARIKSHVSSNARPTQKCALCQQEHYIAYCDKFQAKSANARKTFALSTNLCLNCLGRHSINDCRSKKTCRTCKEKHHSMLHNPSSPSNNENSQSTITDNAVPTCSKTTSHNVYVVRKSPTESLLATAIVNLTKSNGTSFSIRALVDQASEASFVTESLVQRMRLPRSSASGTINGIGGNAATKSRGIVSFQLSPHFKSTFKCRVEAHVISKITSYQPSRVSSTKDWDHLKGILLADPDITSAEPIELLIGVATFADLLLDGVRKGPADAPVAQKTELGWILSGRITNDAASHLTLSSMQTSIDSPLSIALQKFWEQEEVSPVSTQQPEDIECENHFCATHSRDATGRYTVRLPFKTNITDLGDSLTPASRMLQRMQHRFKNDPEIYDLYSAFLKEYEVLNHMELVSSSPLPSSPCYYLPHHGVTRESSSTTKLRVVFNGSQKTNLGVSLNEHLHVGPKLLPDLLDILLRWRVHAIVFSADMEKMYRQILLDERDRDFQRILWQSPTSPKVETYRLRTVTYGLACAPFLAIRVIHQLANDERKRFPVGASTLLTDVYMDDVLSGADDESAALSKQEEIIELLKAGGFSLQKWTSNAPKLLKHLEPSKIAPSTSIVWQPEVFHMLGLSWQTNTDSFVFHVSYTEASPKLTKRNVLSRIAQLFDPLGWLAPVTILAKIFMQSLWLLKLDWDEPLPETEAQRWNKIYSDLPQISKCRIQRWLGLSHSTQHREIHAFADPSERAYSAVLYLRVTDNSSTSVTLLVAKTKVAPVKQISLPRLELCAAHLATKLSKRVYATLELDCPIHLWSDSTVTLAWIRGHPSRWKTYVANRVSDIQTSLPDGVWHHINSQHNPADCASRGILASDLVDHQLWWTGPKWLKDIPEKWPTSKFSKPESLPDERLHSHATAFKIEKPMSLLTRYSNLPKLLRVTAWCLRVITPKHRKRPSQSFLTSCEIDAALMHWIRIEQHHFFSQDIQNLKTGKAISKGKLLPLNPFFDDEGNLRVGGRLKNAILDPDQKHPLIIHQDSPLTTLLIDHCHRQTLHGGTQLTLSTLRQRYWLIGGRTTVKKFIHRCLICARFRADTAQQLMGNLPTNRVTESRPFLHAGVDYAGPIFIRTSKGRGHKAYKAYIAVFVCFATRAVHLEPVSDYTTESFLAAFKRFISRRGRCATISSDCGTNFVGADAELRSLFTAASSELIRIAQLLANDGTKWQFNPPSAPHFGGLWEASVKSVKHHLRRVIGDTTLTFEEMATFLSQVEACLNSRPLHAITDDPDDFVALTPAHFLIGSPLTAVPEPSLIDIPVSRLSRWQHIQQMQRHFWNRWSSEYLHELQTRRKWRNQEDPLQVGDLVLIKNELHPPTKWPLARITEVFPGTDGHIRVAKVKTATSTFTRPIVKLCRLLKNDEEQ